MTLEKKEPIAIVGIGCRFPGGASSPRVFWNMLKRKKDAIVDVPKDRWDLRRFYDENPEKPGKMYVKQGGFLKEKIDRFDPLFFGISPREAESMDPQQRLLLEVTWEAIEDGGLVESDLKGSRTGVFVGGFCMDAMLMRFGQLNRELANSHSAASSTMTMLSNRISYTFDLKGPSVTMDTACSSSLVATHFGCQSIWNGESEVAIVGGVNVMLRPEFPIVMSKGKFLSPHGRCKAFDEDAAGYARGEGAGAVILKPLSAALANKDRVYGLVKETGINQDGRTAGITLPDSESQELLARDVYRRAGVKPSEIGYIEAHGTGTQAGDPAEIKALDRVLRENRGTDDKCFVGSVKTNIGHLEAGAGIAGLIKAALSLHNEKILPNLHFKNPNPKIPWDDVCIQIPTQVFDWKRSDKTRYAGVNSFGYGGANAHVLLQEAPEPVASPESEADSALNGPALLPLSGKSEEAVRELAAKLAFNLARNPEARSVASLFYTLTQRRFHHSHRAALVADDVDTLRNRLQLFSEGEIVDQASTGLADEARASKLVFVYTGMGPQWWGMGRELMQEEPVFRDAIKACDAIFADQAGWSILDALTASESESRMGKTEVAQPANFVIQVGLTELWKSWGVEPYAVIGHSVGEVASAYVSGALSLDDAITVSIHRSRLQQTLAGSGGMLAAGVSEEDALDLISDFEEVSIAAVNSPGSVTLSGDEGQIDELAKRLTERGAFNRRLDVEVAYHSGQMAPIEDAIKDALAEIEPRETRIPLYSTVEGQRVDGESLSADYWWRNVRQPVRFAQGIDALLDANCLDFLEVGPHPVLGHSIREIAGERNANIRLTPSLNRKLPERIRMWESLGQLYTQGQSVHWEAVTPAGGELVSLPLYPWQRERFWIESHASLEDRIGESGFPFLQSEGDLAGDSWWSEVGVGQFPYLKDHVVNEEVVFPGAGYVEAGLEAYRQRFDRPVCSLRDLEFHNILFLKSDETQKLNTVVEKSVNRFSVFGDSSGSRKLHARGSFMDADLGPAKRADLGRLQARLDKEVPTEELYEMLDRRGLKYGPEFRRTLSLHAEGDEFLAKIDTECQLDSGAGEYALHPAIMDTAIHCTLSVIPGDSPFVPISIDRITLRQSIPQNLWCYGLVTKRTDEVVEADLVFLDENSDSIGEVNRLSSRRLNNDNRSGERGGAECLYVPEWIEFEPESEEQVVDSSVSCLLVSRDAEAIRRLESVFEKRGARVVRAIAGSEFQEKSKSEYALDLEEESQVDELLSSTRFEGIQRIFYVGSRQATTVEDRLDAMARDCASFARLAGSLSKLSDPCRLSIVTEGVESASAESVDLQIDQAPLSGLARLAVNELTNLSCSYVDLPRGYDLEFLDSVLDRVYAFSGDTLSVEEKGSYIPKLVRLAEREEETPYESAFQSFEGVPPSAGEVEIEVRRIQISGGGESGKIEDGMATGVVRRVGDGVEGLVEGDRVVAKTSELLSRFVCVNGKCIQKLDSSVSLDDASDRLTIARAAYLLDEVARLAPDESILVHEAAAGLPLAVSLLALRRGSRVVATASSEAEREFLERAGIARVFDAKTLEFVDFMDQTLKGGKVDVVLNSISGEAVAQSLAILESGGRFVDIRSSNERADQYFPAASFGANSLYACVDFESARFRRLGWIESNLEKLDEDALKAVMSGMRRVVYPSSECEKAFDDASKSDFVGQIQIQIGDGEGDAIVQDGEGSLFSQSGSYLITGGTQGFGLALAHWLASKGVGRLYLASRSGGSSEDFEAARAELAKSGTVVEPVAADICDASAVRALADRIAKDGYPLKGVFHGAMVLDDAFLADLDRERFGRVMGPKVRGALNLLEHLDLGELSVFASFSSISTLVGNKGQGNYIAANRFLDRFSDYLRSKGVPGITVNWGVLGESGVVARDTSLGEHLSREGLKGMSNALALEALEMALRSGAAQVGVFDVDWEEWSAANPEIADAALFADLVSALGGSGGAPSDLAVEVARSVAEMEELERQEHIQERLRRGLSGILKLSEKRIDCQQSLDNLGIDSLMLIELAITIQSEFGVRVTTMELLKVGNVAELAELIISKLMEALD